MAVYFTCVIIIISSSSSSGSGGSSSSSGGSSSSINIINTKSLPPGSTTIFSHQVHL